MNYVGIDIHKRYSVCATQDEQGRRLRGVRIEGNSASNESRILADPAEERLVFRQRGSRQGLPPTQMLYRRARLEAAAP